jgi:antitoxin ParD1/3/4
MTTTVEKLSIALTPELTALVKKAVDSGDYASSSEVVREALREWMTRRAVQEHALHVLRQNIHAGIESGAAGDLDISAIKQRGRQRLAASKVKP